MSKGIRRQGREVALKVIYSLQDQDGDVETTLADFWKNFRFHNDVLGEPLEDAEAPLSFEVQRFAEDLINGVAVNLEKIDQMIEEHSTNWALDRMARVDLSLLRMATYELLYRPEIPTSVVINEAIEVGKCYGTKETPAFVNGILDKISRICRQSPG